MKTVSRCDLNYFKDSTGRVYEGVQGGQRRVYEGVQGGRLSPPFKIG